MAGIWMSRVAICMPSIWPEGLARAARLHGAALFEGTRATRLERSGAGWCVHSPQGIVQARLCLLPANGYLSGMHARVHAHVMPLHNYIVTTEPLGRAGAEALIRNRLAVSDSRFVVYYFSHHAPMTGCSFAAREPTPAASRAIFARWCRPHLLSGFSRSLKDARLEHAWGGTLAVTPTRLPYVREAGSGTL